MLFSVLTKFEIFITPKNLLTTARKCHSVFGIKKIIQPDKLDHFKIIPVTCEKHETALQMVKDLYLPEHVLVRDRNMNMLDDCAFDEYIMGLLKQGNSLFAKAKDGSIAGLVVNYASSPLGPKNLRNYALYRQDPNTKDFLNFTAQMQEFPNLWNIFKQPKVFEVGHTQNEGDSIHAAIEHIELQNIIVHYDISAIKMITVYPEFRRQGLGVLLTERSKELALDQGYKVVRFDCMGPHDYKIAERCMMNCIAKFPLHKVRGPNAPYIKRSSDYNVLVRVYVTAQEENFDDFRNIELLE